MKKICVLGLGYIGLPTASMFATHGFQVIGVDINAWVIETLRNGDVHINEPGLKTLVQAALRSGYLRVACEPEPADVFIIAVPTPLYIENKDSDRTKKDEQDVDTLSQSSMVNKRADLRYVIAAAESIVPHLRPGNLVILESTVPPRTTVDVLVPILRRSGLRISGEDKGEIDAFENEERRKTVTSNIYAPSDIIYVAHCPERVLPGRILEELVRNDHVIGGVDRTSAELAKALYASFVEGEIFLTDATTAEMVKLMENTYRDVNIALANEFALIAERLGINIWEAIKLANRHPRVEILKPGPGVGGHCIAIDPWFLVQIAPEITHLIQTARRINETMPEYVVKLVKKALAGQLSRRAEGRKRKQNKPILSRRIACLGLAYKADVGDTRESPAIKVIELLRAEGFDVQAYDPHVQIEVIPGQVHSLEAALNGADLVLILTDHKEFKGLDLKNFAVVDTRNLLDDEFLKVNGSFCIKLGKGF